jgi:hypothetical protein
MQGDPQTGLIIKLLKALDTHERHVRSAKLVFEKVRPYVVEVFEGHMSGRPLLKPVCYAHDNTHEPINTVENFTQILASVMRRPFVAFLPQR